MQQTVFQPQPNLSQQSNTRAQSPSIIFIALTLFALAGLMIGFAVGVFTHRKTPTAKNNNGSSITVTHPKTSPTANVVKTVPLGCPRTLSYPANTETADGSTAYTVMTQATDTTGGICSTEHNKPINTAGITFKLWLVQQIHNKDLLKIPASPQTTLANINSPITGQVNDHTYSEIPGLQFDNTTPQIQKSNAQGQVEWKYQLSPSIQPGTYDLVVFSNWDGQTANWSWIQITIQESGNH